MSLLLNFVAIAILLPLLSSLSSPLSLLLSLFSLSLFPLSAPLPSPLLSSPLPSPPLPSPLLPSPLLSSPLLLSLSVSVSVFVSVCVRLFLRLCLCLLCLSLSLSHSLVETVCGLCGHIEVILAHLRAMFPISGTDVGSSCGYVCHI